MNAYDLELQHDIEYFEILFKDAKQIKVEVLWGLDNPQLEPFHLNFTNTEFVTRLERILEFFNT